MFPVIFPYYITSAITASGGAWNASLVSETVSWGHTNLAATRLGAYITQMTAAGDFLPRLALGIAIMSIFVIVTNRPIWPLYAVAENATRLS
jgi:NitT/TauT family transport system permease protein